jgi:hypothetical protein
VTDFPAGPKTSTEGIRPRRRFFVWIAVAMLVVIALGFGKSFYLRPAFTDRPLPTYLVVHGLVMTAWYLLFLVQASLASIGRTDLHRRLGIAGVLLAVGVVVTATQAQLGFIPRWQAAGLIATPEDMAFSVGFVLAGLVGHIPFVALLALAVLLRRQAATHKRLMYWAVVWTLGPAFTNNRPLGQMLDPLVAGVLPFFPADLFWFAALLVYDWKTLRRIHPATWIGFLLLAFYFLFVTEWLIGIAALQDALLAYVAT